MQKTCKTCEKILDLSNFSPHNLSKDGFRCSCKVCVSLYNKAWRLKNKDKVKQYKRKDNAYFREYKNKDEQLHKYLLDTFGIGLEDYNILLKHQQECCAICKKHFSLFNRRLAVDHCHTTNKIRGLLCFNCNTMLGLSKDSINLLEESIKYLNRNGIDFDYSKKSNKK